MPDKNLSDLFADALLLEKESKYPHGRGILVVDRLENFFEARLNCFLLEKEMIEEDLFLCAGYIAKTLAGFIREAPKRMAAAEFLNSYLECRRQPDSPIRPEDYLARGGQTCFMICVFLPIFHLRRLVDEKYYTEKGTTFFYQLFLETGKPVACHMAEHFEELVPITREVIKE